MVKYIKTAYNLCDVNDSTQQVNRKHMRLRFLVVHMDAASWYVYQHIT